MQSIEELIFEQARNNHNKAAVMDAASGAVVTYAELWDNIRHASLWFQSKGMRRGDRVILAADKNPQFIYAYFGAHLAGLTAIPIDTETNPERLRLIVETASPGMALGSLRYAEAGFCTPFDKMSAPCVGADSYSESISFPRPDDIADILFTTGTTGTPKGVALSFLNESAAARNINEFIGNSEDDVELIALPISHSFGLGRIRCVLSKGGNIVLLGSFASMKKFYSALDGYRITGFGMVPAAWAYITKMSGDRIAEYADRLRYIEIGSAPMPLEEKKRLMNLLPSTRICMHYGLTEASRSTFLNFREDRNHLDTAGKASPNVEIAIFSSEGEKMPPACEGEVCVKGQHVCSDYWGMDKSAFRKDFFGEWFRTGDWGSLSDDGWLTLKGRNKEMINVGGKKVNPLEVEEMIRNFKGISDCACVAMPDSVLGEVVRACIIAGDAYDESSLREYLSSTLENYKVPKRFDIVTEIPRTSSGKIQRLKLR